MLSKTMTLLLGIISRQPVNPYELNKWLTTMNVRRWYPVAGSTVYAALKTAEKKQYISGNAEKSGNMPEKTVYAITEKGKRELTETLGSFLSEFDYDITGFHMGIFFAEVLGASKTLSLLEKRELLLTKQEQGLRRQIRQMEQEQLPRLVVLNVYQSLYLVEAQKKGTQEILAEMRAASAKGNEGVW